MKEMQYSVKSQRRLGIEVTKTRNSYTLEWNRQRWFKIKRKKSKKEQGEEKTNDFEPESVLLKPFTIPFNLFADTPTVPVPVDVELDVEGCLSAPLSHLLTPLSLSLCGSLIPGELFLLPYPFSLSFS